MTKHEDTRTMTNGCQGEFTEEEGLEDKTRRFGHLPKSTSCALPLHYIATRVSTLFCCRMTSR